MKIEHTEIVIEKVHKKYWVAKFKFWDADRDVDLKIDMEFGAPSKERLEFKLEHFKKTGEFLRN